MFTSAQLARTAEQQEPVQGPTWTLRAGTGSLQVAARSAPADGPGSAAVSAIPYLRGWIGDPLTRDFLFAMYRAVYGREWPAADTRENSGLAELLYDALASAFRSGMLVVIDKQAGEAQPDEEL